jgi:hypothetical protein
VTMRRRKRYPNYPLRRAVALLLLGLALVVGSARGCDYLFPAPGASHPHSQVR